VTVRTCDQACYDLAAYFLQDEPCIDEPELYAKHCKSLALAIQEAIEEWFVTPLPE
jgi:hypothetical protein